MAAFSELLATVKSIGILNIVVMVLASFANLFNWIAFTNANWYRDYVVSGSVDYVGYGLWRACSSKILASCVNLDGTNNAAFGTVQAFVMFGFIGVNFLFGVIMLSMFTDKLSDYPDISKVNGIQALVTGVFYLLGIIIFGATVDTSSATTFFGHAFVLAILTMILEIAVGVILVLTSFNIIKGMKVGPSSEKKPKKTKKKGKKEKKEKKEKTPKKAEDKPQETPAAINKSETTKPPIPPATTAMA